MVLIPHKVVPSSTDIAWKTPPSCSSYSLCMLLPTVSRIQRTQQAAMLSHRTLPNRGINRCHRGRWKPWSCCRRTCWSFPGAWETSWRRRVVGCRECRLRSKSIDRLFTINHHMIIQRSQIISKRERNNYWLSRWFCFMRGWGFVPLAATLLTQARNSFSGGNRSPGDGNQLLSQLECHAASHLGGCAVWINMQSIFYAPLFIFVP